MAGPEHQIIVTPDLEFGISLRITGLDRNDIKDYLAEVFYCALKAKISLFQSANDPSDWDWRIDRSPFPS